jgi:tight adherence protein B
MSPVGLALGGLLGAGLWLMVGALFAFTASSGQQSPTIEPGTQDTHRVHSPRLAALLAEAGMERVDARVVIAGGALGALVVGLLVAIVIPIPMLAVIAGGVVPLLGFAYLKRLVSARATRLRRAWPGVIDHLRAGVRSGHDVAGAISALPHSLPSDISDPVRSFEKDIALGLGTDDALAEWGRRLADPVGDRIVEVLRMAHEVGGVNLPTVLVELQRSVRADIAVREDAYAKQSWIRSASVLAVSAPWVVLLLIGSREATISAYQTAEGAGILLLGAVVSAVAFFMMKKIGSLPTPHRWLG